MRKLALIIPSALAIGGLVYYFKIIGSEIALMEMYPDHDPNIVIKVHREIIKETLLGKYGDEPFTDERLEEIFEQKLAARTVFPGLFR